MSHRTAEIVDATELPVPYWVVTTALGNNSQQVHIPSEESTRDRPDAICPRLDKSDCVTAKETVVYPPGHRTVCRECLHYRRQA